MIKSLILLPLALSLFTFISNNFGTNINAKENIYPPEVKYTKYTNQCYEKYEIEKAKNFILSDFSYNVRSIHQRAPLIVKFQEVGPIRYYYTFTAYDENGEILQKLEEKHNTDAWYYSKSFLFDKLETYYGYVDFVFNCRAPILSYDSNLAKFRLLLRGGVNLSEENYSFKAPYEVIVRNLQGYAETFGDYFELRNIKPIINIDDYLIFDFNKLKVRLYTELFNYDYFRFGTVNISFKPQGNIEEFEDYTNFYKNLPSLSREETNNIGLTLYNRNTYYIDPTDNSPHSKYEEGYEVSENFHFDNKYFDLYKETNVLLEFRNFGISGLYFSYTFKLNFKSIHIEKVFDIVGEINKVIEDDELEEVILP